jgi:uncharacterized protein (TIGR02147 family)
MPEVSVYAYSDHRKFLQSTFESKRKDQPNLSLGRFSTLIGFSSANYAGLVIEGKRNLTQETIHRIAKALGMSFEETEWFEAITLLKQSSSEEETRHYRQRLAKLKTLLPLSSARFSPKQLVTHWHYPVILMAVERASRQEAIARVTKILPLSESQIGKIIDQLIEGELLIEDGSTYRLNHSHQVFHDLKSSSVKHKQFLKEQLRLSAFALERCYEKGAKFYSHTFSLSKSDFAVCENRLRALLSEFTALSDASDPDEVAQLNIQLFRIVPELG